MREMRSQRNQFTEEQFRAFVDDQPDESEQELQPHEIIEVARRIYNQSRQATLPIHEKDNWKKRYINKLLDFGYRFKGEWEESGQAARKLFEDALLVECILPIAHYRLGHICLKRKELGESVNHFYTALQQMNQYPDSRYIMDEIQSETAMKLLESTCNKISNLCRTDFSKTLGFNGTANDPEIKPVVMWIFKNGAIQKKNQVSLLEYGEIKDRVEADPNSMFVDAYQSHPSVGFKREDYISPGNYSLLIGIVTGNLLDEIDNEKLLDNTFNQRLTRLRTFFGRLGLVQPDFIISKEPGKLPAIYSKIEIFIFKHIEE